MDENPNGESPKMSLSRADIQKWSTNVLIFLAPLALIYLPFVTLNVKTDGLAWSDFVPNNLVLGAMVLYILNALTDIFRKLVKGPSR